MQYYLYQPGQIDGPFNSNRLEDLKKSGKLRQYHWMIDSESQIWKSISDAPTENPFETAQRTMRGRLLSGAFILANEAYSGRITNLSSFGIELVIPQFRKFLRGINQSRALMLNICDETNQVFVNVRAQLHSQSQTEEGLILKFNWENQGVSL